MKLHNTLTRTIEDFKPLKDNLVRFYSCGPTVYDHVHIGNLRAYIFADTLHRTLELTGFEVSQVMNYTDIDDKTVARSRLNYPEDEPMAALHKLTEHYTKLFLDDMQGVGNRIDNITFTPATEHIERMKTLVTDLYNKGFAYISDDGIYFSIDKYRASGKKYGQLLEITIENTSEARIQNDEYDKESAHDFALWKKQKEGEPAWEFTVDGHNMTGRPGWHIECSAMSRGELGQPFDLHTGGVDNMFPHHENEIAQSTAGEDNPVMAQFFTHNEHILVDGKKMAKSAGNFYTLADVTQKGFDPLAFRLLVLQAHYRSQVNFTWESLEAARNRLQSLRALADLRFQPITAGDHESVGPDYPEYTSIIKKTLQDDLATPRALAIVSGLIDEQTEHIHQDNLEEFTAFLHVLDDAFGLQLLQSKDISGEQKGTITQREEARNNKDWATSDSLRDLLEQQGIGLRDTAHGAIWHRLRAI